MAPDANLNGPPAVRNDFSLMISSNRFFFSKRCFSARAVRGFRALTCSIGLPSFKGAGGRSRDTPTYMEIRVYAVTDTGPVVMAVLGQCTRKIALSRRLRAHIARRLCNPGRACGQI